MDFATLALHDYTAGIRAKSSKASGYSNAAPCVTTKRRCRTREQGVALMIVGHAIEYLVDSRIVNQQQASDAEREALEILLDLNLLVYNEGTEIKPLAGRLVRWFRGGIAKHAPEGSRS